MKSVLHDTEVTPDYLHQVFSNDVRLTYDEQKLMDCGIIKNSIVHAYIENSVSKVFLLKRPYADVSITVYMRTFDTIKDVKYRIGIKEGANSKQFSLIHEGKFLDDDKTFYKSMVDQHFKWFPI